MDMILLIILVALDQFTKYIAVLKLKNQAAFSIIDGGYKLPTFGVGGSRSPAGCGVMAHPPMWCIQNVSVALYCAAVILRAFFVKVQRRAGGRGTWKG